jgi:predicted transcriptional regulator
MDWGLTQTQGWAIDRSIPATVQTIGMLVEPDLLRQGQEAAAAQGTSVAVWLRHARRQVTPGDFPPSWRAGETSIRSHDSSRYGRRFMLRLDQETSAKLPTLTQGLDRPAAAIIRQLIAHAVLEDFPESWHMAVKAWQQRQRRS